jgi:hypothetical protein
MSMSSRLPCSVTLAEYLGAALVTMVTSLATTPSVSGRTATRTSCTWIGVAADAPALGLQRPRSTRAAETARPLRRHLNARFSMSALIRTVAFCCGHKRSL